MAVTVAFFDSAVGFKNHVEQSISQIKTELGVALGKTEEVRRRYEISKAQLDSVRKHSGKKEIPKDTKQMELAGFRVLVNPSADYELSLMEESVSSLQEKIETLEKTKELFPSLPSDNMKIAMVLNEGVPAGFMFYMPQISAGV